MKFTLTATALTALVGLTAAGHDKGTFAVLRFNNKQLTQGRMDPIVSPGKPSAHVHTVMGASGFSLSSTGKDLENSKCSNAMIKGDNSNYWFPSLYFQDPKKGTFEPVEVFYVNAYYFFEATNDDLKAFPLGMSMVSGNGTTRIVPEGRNVPNLDPSKGPVNPAMWTCPRSTYDPPSWPPGSDGSLAGIGNAINKGEGVGFPDFNCDGYASPLRADVHFPSCYNPEAGLTSFGENMAWPTDNKGKLDCPKGYMHVPHLFLEVYWNTPLFADRWEQGKGHQPFVLSSGDATGFSSHGDFMSGWDEKLLQHIIDTCDAGTGGMDNCPGLFYGLNKGDCTMDSLVDEKIDGVLSKLPGNNPVEGWYYGVDGSHAKPVPVVDEKPSSAASPPAASQSSNDDATTKTAFSETVSQVASQTTSQASSQASSQTASKAVSEAAKESTSSKAISAAAKESTSSQYRVESEANTSSSKLATAPTNSPTVTASSDPEVAKPTLSATGVLTQAGKSSCKRKIHTVYQTVTVTQTAAEGSAQPESTENPIKRQQFERHMHDHARRHGSHHH